MDDFFATTEYASEEPQKKKNNWLIGCGATFLVIACIVSFVLIGGFAGLLALVGGESEGLTVSVSSPSSNVMVGETFEIWIILSNTGSQNINIKSVHFPNVLLDNAVLTNISPNGIEGEASGNARSFKFDLVIAPTSRETLVFTFEASNPVEIDGGIDIEAGTQKVTNRLKFSIFPVTTDAESPVVSGNADLGEVIPYRSVVQIVAIVEIEGQRYEGWTGSGTIISDDGLILTNAHVVLSDRYFDVVDLVVAITVAQDSPPEQMFYADVVQGDVNLDLAVIKVRSDLGGGPPNFADLSIEPVPLGNSDELTLGDEIIIIGYPGIGGETITLTRGEVSGFTSEQSYGNRAFIKTSATIAGGNSGGLAATKEGKIIGVPTQVGSGDFGDMIVDCRPLADTNRDGVIDESDTCVPTGGFINALRPIQLALPMINAAREGQVAIDSPTRPDRHEEFEPEGNVILNEDFTNNVNGWSLFEDEGGSIDILNGQMVFSINAQRLIYWSMLPTEYDNVILIAEPSILNSVGDGDFGFVCAYQDSGNFTALEISEDGYYSIWKYESDQYISLVEWTYDEVIAGSSPNSLAAYCGPDGLALAVNDTLLVETVDPRHVPGRVGLLAGCWDDPEFRLGYDNFFILQP
jgi:S1-C subfamily serine protease